MIFFDILTYSLSSIIWGILIAVVCVSLFVFLIKGWYKDATFSPVSYIVGAVLFLLLTFQCVLVVGSLKIVSMSEEYEQYVSSIVDSMYSQYEEITTEQSSEIVDRIINEYPILQYYIGGGEFTGYTAQELPHAIAQELRSYMYWYIFRRILWCLGFSIFGSICVIKSLSQKHPIQSYRSMERQRIQRDRKRIGRRTRL